MPLVGLLAYGIDRSLNIINMQVRDSRPLDYMSDFPTPLFIEHQPELPYRRTNAVKVK